VDPASHSLAFDLPFIDYKKISLFELAFGDVKDLGQKPSMTDRRRMEAIVRVMIAIAQSNRVRVVTCPMLVDLVNVVFRLNSEAQTYALIVGLLKCSGTASIDKPFLPLMQSDMDTCLGACLLACSRSLPGVVMHSDIAA
jgi:hypothetical protein